MEGSGPVRALSDAEHVLVDTFFVPAATRLLQVKGGLKTAEAPSSVALLMRMKAVEEYEFSELNQLEITA